VQFIAQSSRLRLLGLLAQQVAAHQSAVRLDPVTTPRLTPFCA